MLSISNILRDIVFLTLAIVTVCMLSITFHSYKKDDVVIVEQILIKPLIEMVEVDDVKIDITKSIHWMSLHAQWYVPRSELEVIYNEVVKYSHPEMLLAIISIESNFDRYAMNKRTDCYGLMQIRWMIWKNEKLAVPEIGDHLRNVDELFDPKRNIEFGNKILMSYKGEETDWEKALMKYSNGSTRYVSKVLTRYYELMYVTSNNVTSNNVTM